MTLTAKKTEGTAFAPAPQGSHLARCYMLIDLGTHNYDYAGAAKRQRKVRIGWELVNETMEDGRPFTVSKKYTLSLNRASTLRKDLVSWRGREFTQAEEDAFDLPKLLDAPCLLGLVHETKEDRVYANISSLMLPPKGTQVSPLVNELVTFDLDEFDPQAFQALPEWVQKEIKQSEEWGKMYPSSAAQPFTTDQLLTDVTEDDIPF